MATFLKGVPMKAGGASLGGPALSADDIVALQNAPKKSTPRGTTVRVRAYDIAADNLKRLTGLRLWDSVERVLPDHMYTEFDDGQEQYIFRGGPSRHGLHAQVDPAARSPDYGRGTRVLHERFLPDTSAREAARPARAEAQRIEASGWPYGGAWSNSNMAVAEQMRSQFDQGVGDGQTWGARPERLYPMTQPIW